MSETLEKREQAADRIRDELALTLRELERRRHAVGDLRSQVQRHRELVALAGAGLAGVATLALVTRVWRQRRARRPEVLRRQRLEALRRAWTHPEQLATRPSEPPLAQAALRRMLSVCVLAVANRLARTVAVRLLPGPGPRRAPRVTPGTVGARA